jgi:parallel beta-helix repeat protein
MKRTIFIIAIIALSLVFAVSAFAVTRCVNPIGTGGCYSSIQAAVNASSANDIINVFEGRYDERVAIEINNLTIKGMQGGLSPIKGSASLITDADPAKVIVDALESEDGCAGIYISGEHVTIMNLTVRHSMCDCNIVSEGMYTTLNKVRLISGLCGAYFASPNATITNSSFLSNGPVPALMVESDNATVTNNKLLNNAGGAIVVGSNAQVKNNQIIAEGGSSVKESPVMQLLPQRKTPQQEIPYPAESACLTVGSGENIKVESNTIANCANTGIYVLPSYDVKVWTNTISGSPYGIVLEGQLQYVLSNTVKGTFVGILGSPYDGFSQEIMNSIASGTLSQTVEKYATNYRQLLTANGENSVYESNTVTEATIVGYMIFDNNPSIVNNKASNVPSTYYGNRCAYLIWANNPSISGNYASHSSTGFVIWTNSATISNNTAEYNTLHGFEIDLSYGGTISGNSARYNGGGEEWAGGFLINTDDSTTISSNTAVSNQMGFVICSDSPGNTFTGNISSSNYEEGVIFECGGSLDVTNNTVTDNSGEGIANYLGNISTFTGNAALRNRTDICNEGGTLPAPAPGNTFGTYDPTNCDLL